MQRIQNGRSDINLTFNDALFVTVWLRFTGICEWFNMLESHQEKWTTYCLTIHNISIVSCDKRWRNTILLDNIVTNVLSKLEESYIIRDTFLFYLLKNLIKTVETRQMISNTHSNKFLSNTNCQRHSKKSKNAKLIVESQEWGTRTPKKKRLSQMQDE